GGGGGGALRGRGGCGRARVGAGGAADPAGDRLSGAVAGGRADGARRRRVGALPRAGGADLGGDRDGGTGFRGVDRYGARAALSVSAAGVSGGGSGLASVPVEPGSDERRSGRTDDRERGEPADRALGGAGGARGLGRGGAAGRMAGPAGPRLIANVVSLGDNVSGGLGG